MNLSQFKKAGFIPFLILPFITTESFLDVYNLHCWLFLAIYSMFLLFVFLKEHTLYISKSNLIICISILVISIINVFFALDYYKAIINVSILISILSISIIWQALITHDKNFKILILNSLKGISIVTSIYVIIKILNNDVEASYQIIGFLKHRNILAAFLTITTPLYFPIINSAKKEIFANLLLLIIQSMAIMLLGSRSSMLALLVVFLLYCIYQINNKRYWFPLFFATLTLLAIISRPEIIHNIELSISYDYISSDKGYVITERFSLWGKTFSMIKEHLLFGVGAGNWSVNLPYYNVGGLRADTGDIVFQRPHNEYLRIISEYGIIVFVLFLMLIINIFKGFNKVSINQNLSILGLLIISFFSFPLESPFIIISIIVISVSKPRNLKNNRVVINKSILYMLLISTSLIFLVRTYNNNKVQFLYQLQAMMQLDALLIKADELTSRGVKIDNYNNPIAYQKSIVYFSTQKYDESLNQLSESLLINPYHIKSYNLIGDIYLYKKDTLSAVKNYTKCLQLSSSNKFALKQLIKISLMESNFNQTNEYLHNFKLIDVDKELLLLLKENTYLNVKSYFDNEERLFVQEIYSTDKWFTHVVKEAITHKRTLIEQVKSEINFSTMEELSN